MTTRDLAVILVRLAGIGIGMHLLLSTGQWLNRHWADLAGALTLPLLGLFLSWLAGVLFLVKKPDKIAALFIVDAHADNQNTSSGLRDIERLLLSLLGMFFLSLAAIELSEIIAYQVSYQTRISNSPYTFWLENSADFKLNIVSVAAKTLIGIILVVGSQTAQKILRWARTAGRNWDLD